MNDQWQCSTNAIGVPWTHILLELGGTLELFMSQGPKLMNAIRIHLEVVFI